MEENEVWQAGKKGSRDTETGDSEVKEETAEKGEESRKLYVNTVR